MLIRPKVNNYPFQITQEILSKTLRDNITFLTIVQIIYYQIDGCTMKNELERI
jgi:hypothetical protein